MITVTLQWLEWYYDDKSGIAMIRVTLRWLEWCYDDKSGIAARPSILCVTQKRAFMPFYIVLGQ